MMEAFSKRRLVAGLVGAVLLLSTSVSFAGIPAQYDSKTTGPEEKVPGYVYYYQQNSLMCYKIRVWDIYQTTYYFLNGVMIDSDRQWLRNQQESEWWNFGACPTTVPTW